MLTINIKTIEELSLSINEVLCLYKIKYPELDYTGLPATYKMLEQKRFIKIYTETVDSVATTTYVLREQSENLLEDMESQCESISDKPIKKVSNRKLNIMLTENLVTFRNKWKGLAPGSMGGKKSCEEKLARWIKENPEYSFEDILKACDIYINSFNGNFKYLQRADYFIFKKDGKEESSRLSAFIEEIDMEVRDDDWTTHIS